MWLTVTLAVIVALGVHTAVGWYFGRKFERKWASIDRRELRREADLEEQLKLLRYLNGDLQQKWTCLLTHKDAQDLEKSEPVANEIGTWCYKHSSYFPEGMERTLIDVGNIAFRLATENRKVLLEYVRLTQKRGVWRAYIQKYQREVERKLGLPGTS